MASTVSNGNDRSEKWHRPFQMATTVYEREICVDARIRTRATLVRGECSHHCATLAKLTTKLLTIETQSFRFVVKSRFARFNTSPLYYQSAWHRLRTRTSTSMRFNLKSLRVLKTRHPGKLHFTFFFFTKKGTTVIYIGAG